MNDYCTDGLKNCLIALPDYESTIRDDPLALLTAIKTCVHKNARTQYPPVTISTHWDRLLKLKQAEEEDPPSYAKRFEQQLKTAKGYTGSTFIDGFAEQMPEYKAQAYRHDTGKITTLLNTHVTDVDACQALAEDLIELFSYYKQSTILLLENGKSSSTKRTRALNIRYFYLTDQIEKGNSPNRKRTSFAAKTSKGFLLLGNIADNIGTFVRRVVHAATAKTFSIQFGHDKVIHSFKR